MTGVRQPHPLRIDTTIMSPACLRSATRCGSVQRSAVPCRVRSRQLVGMRSASSWGHHGASATRPTTSLVADRCAATRAPIEWPTNTTRSTSRRIAEARIPRREAHRAQDCSSRVSGIARVAPSPNSPGCAEENGPARSSADWPAATFAKPMRPWVCRPVAPGHRRARRYSCPHRIFVAIDLADGSPSALLLTLSVLGRDGATRRRSRLTHRSARRRVSWTVPTVGRSARYTPRGCARSSRGRVRRPDAGPGRAWRACVGARPC